MINLKKIALIVLGGYVACSANAQVYMPPPELPPPPAPEPVKLSTKQGVYFGIGTGGISLDDKMSTSGTATLTSESSTVVTSSSTHAGNTGFNGNAFIGYSWKTPNRFFMGIEGFGQLMDISASTTTTNSSTVSGSTSAVTSEPDIKFDYVYGIRTLPGYQITPNAVIYGIVGYANAHSKNDLTISSSGTSSTSVSAPVEENTNFSGYQLGLGSMIEASPHVAVRGDLIYTGYGSETLSTGTQTTSTGTMSGSVESTPVTLEADVSLVIKFD